MIEPLVKPKTTSKEYKEKPKVPKVMSKKSNRGEYAKEEGSDMGKKKKELISYLEGTKKNPKMPMKSLTPKAPMKKK